MNELSPDAIVGQFFHAITGNQLSTTQQQLVDQIFVNLRKRISRETRLFSHELFWPPRTFNY